VNARTTVISGRRIDRSIASALLVVLGLLVLLATAVPAAAAEQPRGADALVQLQPEPEPEPSEPDGLAPPQPEPEPQGPDDFKQPEGGEPTVTIDVEPRCAPQPGVAYEISVDSPPPGALAYKAQWREPGGQVQTVDGQSGSIPTGEGEFEIRGVLHYQGPGFYPTDFVEVAVDCPGDPGAGDGRSDDPPLVGTPNFTG
jgi:hypothetical protein